MKTGTARGLGCLLLFALPFAAVGVFAGGLAVKMIWDWAEASGWEEVPARILDARLIEHEDSDGSTYRVEAQYRYTYRGETFVGERVSLTSFADNIGSYQRDRHRELAAHRGADSRFRCYVDPHEPSRSILFREIRWGLLGLILVFALVFGGVGFGLIAGGVWGKRQSGREAELQQRQPEEPWCWNPEWREGRIRSNDKAAVVAALLFAAVWNLISWPVAFVLPGEIDSGNRLAWIALIFPLVGILLAVSAVRSLLRWRRFGTSIFVMRSMPGVIGGWLEGEILVPSDLRAERGIELTLSCIRREASGSGKNRSTQERVLWQDATRVGRERLGSHAGGVTVPVRFGIPHGLEASGDSGSQWRLTARAVVAGVDYDTGFEVPVFLTRDSDPDFEAEPSAGVEHEARAEIDLAAAGIRSEHLPTGARRFVFPAARHKGPALGLTVFCAIWVGAIVLLLRIGAPLLLPIVFSLFGILLLWGVLDLWFGIHRVEIDGERLILSGGLFGIGPRRVIRRDQIAELRATRGMQAGNRLYYRVTVATKSGKQHVAAGKLESLVLAKRVIGEMKACLPGV